MSLPVVSVVIVSLCQDLEFSCGAGRREEREEEMEERRKEDEGDKEEDEGRRKEEEGKAGGRGESGRKRGKREEEGKAGR